MIKNYFKIAWRNLKKNKIYTSINVTGLAVGIAASILIMLFVMYEWSFDNFHTKNIYRLSEVQKPEGMASSQKVALSMFPMGPTLKSEFPEVQNYCRVRWSNKMDIRYNEKRVYLPQGLLVDSTFLQMFDFKLITGNRKTVLQEPNNAVLTQESAAKLFGNEDPVGKTIRYYSGDTVSFKVAGIIENVPQNSHMQFDMLISFNSVYRSNPGMMNNWGGNWLDTYLELSPGADAAALEKKFPAYLKKYMAQNDNWKSYELFVVPLKNLHGATNDIGLDYLNYQKFDRKYTNIFFIIGIIVLLIACINFMNLSTARSSERAKEVGIRKTVGALRWQLSAQFISESVLLSFIALVIAVILVKLLLPFVNELSQRQLSFPVFTSFSTLISVVAGTVCVGLLAGAYPAAYLSSFIPVKVLKGVRGNGSNISFLRNALVVGQFASAIFLMIATMFAVKQLRYMQKQDPGYDREQVVTIPLNNNTYKKYDVLKKQLLGNTLISGVTAAQDQLGSHLDQSGVQFRGDGPSRDLVTTRLIVDNDYLSLYKIPLAAGKNFSSESAQNGKEYIINEALAQELQKDNPKSTMESLIGKNFGFDSAGVIVGIAKNFNFNTLHHKIETMFMFNQKDWGFNTLSVKINGARSAEALAFIESVWKKENPDFPFEYQFLDDHFAEIYRADSQVSSIVGILAGLAIAISCLGLFGLASYAAERRVKEVGIRKVLGASVQNITTMLSKDFLRYVAIATLIAWPLAWFAVNKWLQDYAYRVNISWWIFVLAGVAACLIALITISFQSVKAARANPVKSLRTE